jgi:hypothetical protein
VDGLLGDSTLFAWAGCHNWYQSGYMHWSLINNLNHWFLKKFAKIIGICKIRWSVQDNLDQEALEGIFGFFQVAY